MNRYFDVRICRSVQWIAILTITLSICLVSKGVHAQSQGLTSSGTDFWVGFFPNERHTDTTLVELFLASTAVDTALVTYDDTTWAYPLIPNSVLTVDLRGRGITSAAETPSNNSVHIESRSPITVYGFFDRYGNYELGGSPDGFLALPTLSLGTEYYTMNYMNEHNFDGMNGGEFLVVAPYDSTVITITAKAHTQDSSDSLSHSPGDTWQVMLMRGQSYFVQSIGFPDTDDLTGSHIIGSKPIALLTGHRIAAIPITASSADYLIEMMPPADRWGTEYFEIPMAGRTICGDYIRILSAEDSNVITANGVVVATLNAGEWTAVDTVTTPQVYSSLNGKRFVVAQYSYSSYYLGDTVPADPFMMLLVPREQFEHWALLRTPVPAQNNSFAHYLTIIAPADSMDAIKINDVPATSYSLVGQTTFPGTSPPMGALRIRLPDGSASYVATSSVTFGLYQYGYINFEGYGWPAGISQNLFTSTDKAAPAQTYVNSCGDYTVTITETRQTDSHLAGIQLITQPGDSRWDKPSYNYAVQIDPGFRPGDSVVTFPMTVIDPSKPAYAAVWVADLAGNTTVYEYTNALLPYSTAVDLSSGAQQSHIVVTPGQTFDLRLAVKDLSGIHSSSIGIDGIVTNDDDALTLTSVSGMNGWDVTTTTLNPGVTQLHCVPSSSASLHSGEEIANLHFESFLTKTLSTAINIENVAVAIEGNLMLPCGTSSVNVDFSTVCGDSLISNYLATGSLTNSLRAYPNPAHDNITVVTKISSQMNATLYLYNALGARLHSFAVSPGEEEQTATISDLPSGIYFLRLCASSGEVVTREIIVDP